MTDILDIPGATVRTEHSVCTATLRVNIYPELSVSDFLVGKNYMLNAVNAAEAKGLRLIQLWRSEVQANSTVFQKLIRNAAGVDDQPAVGGRSCELDPTVSWPEARAFYAAHHPQGSTASLHETLGLRYQGELVALMSFSRSADRRGAAANSFTGASLSRFATSRRVAGAGSKLLAAWRKTNPGVAIMSYSDPRMFTGALYQTLGFTLVKVGKPDYLVYNPFNNSLRHKSAFQRSKLEGWRKQLGRDDISPYDHATDPRTEFQMEDAMGMVRVYNAGLLRWELGA